MNLPKVLLPVLLGSMISCTAGAPPRFERAADSVRLHSRKIDEASGAAVSMRNDSLLWLVNDSGSPPVLHLAGIDGADHGRVKIARAKNIDWEAICSFEIDGQPYLLIADVGDNASTRNFCTLYLLHEPRLTPENTAPEGEVRPAHVIRFRYEDGPRDCEAVAVDAAARKIILISKRTKPPMVYELPLRLHGKDEMLTAVKTGETAVKPPRGTLPLPFIDQPTGLDISRDGTFAAVVTYYGAFVFPREKEESWAQAFAKEPLTLQPHRLSQAESIAISSDGKTIRVFSEGENQPVVRYHR